LTVRGEFANKDQQLLPGMYVKVRTRLGFEPNAILIPQRAVSRNNQGQQQVWVVNSKGEVEARVVTAGVMVRSDWQITAGIAEGDVVLTSSISQLQPGDKIQTQLAGLQESDRASASSVTIH
jgi:multidrug efflux system membrane fusion protein